MLDFHHAHGVGGTLDGDGAAFAEALAVAVGGEQEVSAAGMHAQSNLNIVAHHNGARGKAVGRNGREAERAGAGRDDRAAHAERIARGARGCAYDEAVGHVMVEQFAVDGSFYLNQGRIVVFQDRHLVEREGAQSERLAFNLHRQNAVRLDDIVALAEAAQGRGDVAGRHVGQKTEPSGVDAEYRHSAAADAGGRVEKRAVAAHGNGEREVFKRRAGLYDAATFERKAKARGEKLGKGGFHRYFRFELVEHTHDGLHISVLLRLINVAEEGNFQWFAVHRAG